MGDLISRQAVNEVLYDLGLGDEENGGDPEYMSALYDCKEFIDQIPSVENKGEWIPVSERLPEERTAVLVYVPEWKNIYCAYYEPKNEQWWIFGTYTKLDFEVVAWQPLPEPYKAESEE